MAHNGGLITIDDIRVIATTLPDVEERPSYGGRPSWRTPERMFAWVRDDPEALVVWVDSTEMKDVMVDNDPGRFFTTSHYDGQPIVLVRLDGVDPAEAAELIVDSWRLRAPARVVRTYDDGDRGSASATPPDAPI